MKPIGLNIGNSIIGYVKKFHISEWEYFTIQNTRKNIWNIRRR